MSGPLFALCVVLVVLAAGAWRWIDGAGWGPTWARVAVAVVIASAAGYLGLGLNLWLLWIAPVALASVLIGQTDWEDWGWMACRYSTFAALAVLPLGRGLGVWIYVGLCGAAGLVYPLLFAIDARRKAAGKPIDWGSGFGFDGPEAWARIPLGMATLGGLTVLGING